MAAVVTITEETYGTVKKVRFAITSHTDGTASDETTNAFSGEVLRMVAVPASGGDQPTDQFDIEVQDEDGYDILAGQGGNLSNASPTTVVASMGAIANDKMTVSATNMGDTKKADIIVYVR